jgi:hypothetical protein
LFLRERPVRAAGVRAVRATVYVWLCRSKSRVGPLGDTRTVIAQRSVVVGCFRGIPSDRCRWCAL